PLPAPILAGDLAKACQPVGRRVSTSLEFANAYSSYKASSMKVAMAGGGIGGMALALSLAAAGIDDVDIYESAPAIRELGVGINVLPHGVRELTELGLLHELTDVGIPTGEFVYYSKHGQR